MLVWDQSDAVVRRVADALANLARRSSARLTVERVNGQPVAVSPLAGALQELGFTVGYKGMVYRPSAKDRSGARG